MIHFLESCHAHLLEQNQHRLSLWFHLVQALFFMFLLLSFSVADGFYAHLYSFSYLFFFPFFFQESDRVVTKKEGLNFARESGCLFIECSAKTRVNVQQCFEELVLKVRKLLKWIWFFHCFLDCKGESEREKGKSQRERRERIIFICAVISVCLGQKGTNFTIWQPKLIQTKLN